MVSYLDLFIADRPWDSFASQIHDFDFIYLNDLTVVFQKPRSHSKEAKLNINRKNSPEVKYFYSNTSVLFIFLIASLQETLDIWREFDLTSCIIAQIWNLTIHSLDSQSKKIIFTRLCEPPIHYRSLKIYNINLGVVIKIFK